MSRIAIAPVLASFALCLSAGAEPPDPMDLLAKADAATKAVKKVSYRAEIATSGRRAEGFPKVRGKVVAKPARKRGLIGRLFRNGPALPRLSIEAEVTPRGSDEPRRVRVATDERRVTRIDDTDKTYTQAKMPDATRLLGAAYSLYLLEFLHEAPFSDELNGKSATYEGTRKIGGVDCDVVHVVYNVLGSQESRWYFGRDDHLPRRVDRIGAGRRGDFSIIITELDPDPDFDDDVFSPERPAGYKKTEIEKPRRDPPRALLVAGTTAPDWSLQTPQGRTVSLKDLRGRIVVLDFWATWCGLCKMAMPGVQKIHERFEDKPVEVFGMNTWERGGDPAAYMKKKDYTYGLLLKADDVAKAYHVSGIPTFYVIGPDGKILLADVGAGHEKAIVKTIEESLPDTEL
ncbi:MAG: TlpA family protein disulfide reductase [Phycisphaerae bacterium]